MTDNNHSDDPIEDLDGLDEGPVGDDNGTTDDETIPVVSNPVPQTDDDGLNV